MQNRLPIILAALSIALLTATAVFMKSNSSNNQSIHCLRTIINEREEPSKPLQEILNLFGIMHDNTIASIVQETQKIFKRPDGKERWQIDEIFSEKKEAAFKVLNKIGCIDEVKPTHKQYDYGVIMGGTLPRMRLRIAHLINLWNSGVTFNKIVFLGGQRPLDPKLEAEHMFFEAPEFIRKDWKLNSPLPKTEIDMMRMVYDQAEIPQEMAQIPTLFVDSPMEQQPDGSMKRPTTASTVKQWLKDDASLQGTDQPSVLIISSQPHVGYQDAVMRTLLPKHFIIETIGLGISEHMQLAEILDALARWLYQEQERRKIC